MDSGIEILEENKETFFLELQEQFPFTKWGRIDWKSVENKITVSETSQHEDMIEKNMTVYIIWDEMSAPVIKSNLHSALCNIDDITAVSFDTWIFSPDHQFVIEFYHDGEITIGYNINKVTNI